MKDPVERERAIDELNRLVGRIRVAMLVTQEPEAGPRARPMVSRPLDADGQVWFVTSLSSGMAADVARDPRVAVVYADPEAHRYVSLGGRARVVHDRERVERAWTALDLDWHPKGKDDPDLALLCVQVERAEYWDTPSSTMVVLFEWARTRFGGHASEAGHGRTIELGG